MKFHITPLQAKGLSLGQRRYNYVHISTGSSSNNASLVQYWKDFLRKQLRATLGMAFYRVKEVLPIIWYFSGSEE